ncbi:MAG TPA: hypothetical protein ENJ31_01070 [Anaerolineae bacterium]|nr:hypothetical protein [Anaerolineae bacterium]
MHRPRLTQACRTAPPGGGVALFGVILLLAAAVTTMTGCASKPVSPPQLPCWMQQPISETRTGQIGMAREVSSRVGDSAVEKSRRRALSALALYLGEDAAAIAHTDVSKDRIHYAGHEVFFSAPHRRDGYIYSYAALGEQAAQHREVCDLARCVPKRCEPAWLCEPSTGKVAGFLGLSFQASSLARQYQLALANAALQIQYTHGLDVVAQERFLTVTNGSRGLRLKHFEQHLTPSAAAGVTRLGWSDSCWNGGTLFLRALSPGLPVGEPVNSREWISNPNLGGHVGAVGIVENDTASGLFSDRLELAIQRGITELALGEYANVREESYLVERSDRGRYIASFLVQDSRITVSARVLAAHFEQSNSGRLKIYVWVVKQSL